MLIHTKRLERLPPYLFGKLKQMTLERRRQGIDVVDLSMGNPDRPTPENIVQKLCEAACDPRNHRYSASRGIFNLRREAAWYYERRFGVDLDPENSQGWLLVQYLEQHEGNFEKSAEAMEMYMKLTGDRDFTAVFKLAQLYFTINKEDKAKEVIFSGIKREETPAAEMMQAAEFLIANGLTDDALSIYLRLIERDPTDEKAWIQIGAIHNIEGREKEAEQTYKLALEKNPDSFIQIRSIGKKLLITK